MQTPEIICLKSNVYYALLDEILEHISTKFSIPQKQWLLTNEAMLLLGISSKTTLQQLRDTGKIRYSQPQQGVFTLDNNETQSNFLIMS